MPPTEPLSSALGPSGAVGRAAGEGAHLDPVPPLGEAGRPAGVTSVDWSQEARGDPGPACSWL